MNDLIQLVVVGSWMVLSSISPWACPRPPERVRPLLDAPDMPRPALWGAPDSPLFPVAQAYQQGDCRGMVELSEGLMTSIRAEVRDRFHPLDSVRLTAATLRSLLDTYVYVEPPILELGPHRFEFSRWWMERYAFCLVEQGRFDQAADRYLDLYRSQPDPEFLWRLALVYGWSGQREAALELISRWPTQVPAPFGFSRVQEILLRGEPLPVCIQEESVQVN